MGFLNRFFDNTQSSKDAYWDEVLSVEHIDEIFESSSNQQIVIYKHSNQCGTSFFAKKNIEIIDKSDFENAGFYIIDVIRQRPLSNYLAEKVGVRHESPQLIILKDKIVTWHGSHHQVSSNNLLSALS